MEKVTIINQDTAASIEFSSTYPYLLGEITGIGEADIIPQSDDACGINGSIRRAPPEMGERYPKFDFWIQASTHAGLHTMRKGLYDVIDAQSEKELIFVYENDGAKYRLLVDCIYGPVPLSKKGKDRTLLEQHFEVGFVAYQPLWESYTESYAAINSLGSLSGYGELINSGQAPTPIRFEFTGAMTAFSVYTIVNDDLLTLVPDEKIEVDYALASGEQLVIDTSERAPSVTFIDTSGNKEDAFDKISADTDFFMLKKGSHWIAAEVATGSFTGVAYWRNRFKGV